MNTSLVVLMVVVVPEAKRREKINKTWSSWVEVNEHRGEILT